MVHFEEMNPFEENIKTFYPSWLLGFITSNGTREVVIQCSLNPLSWEDIQQKFVVDIEIGQNSDASFVFVPIELIVHPLCIFPDNGDNLNKHKERRDGFEQGMEQELSRNCEIRVDYSTLIEL